MIDVLAATYRQSVTIGLVVGAIVFVVIAISIALADRK
jgi:hypothetical protein